MPDLNFASDVFELRAAEQGLGHTVVVTQSPLVLKAGLLPRLDSAADGVLALQALRAGSPAGSEDAWARAGLEVVGRRCGAAASGDADAERGKTESSAWLRRARPADEAAPSEAADVPTVLGSGSLGLVTLPGPPRRLTPCARSARANAVPTSPSMKAGTAASASIRAARSGSRSTSASASRSSSGVTPTGASCHMRT